MDIAEWASNVELEDINPQPTYLSSVQHRRGLAENATTLKIKHLETQCQRSNDEHIQKQAAEESLLEGTDPYAKRKRHKINVQRYEPKETLRKTKNVERKAKRGKKACISNVQASHAKRKDGSSTSGGRLTIKPAIKSGMFRHGLASSPYNNQSKSSLTFDDERFLLGIDSTDKRSGDHIQVNNRSKYLEMDRDNAKEGRVAVYSQRSEATAEGKVETFKPGPAQFPQVATKFESQNDKQSDIISSRYFTNMTFPKDEHFTIPPLDQQHSHADDCHESFSSVPLHHFTVSTMDEEINGIHPESRKDNLYDETLAQYKGRSDDEFRFENLISDCCSTAKRLNEYSYVHTQPWSHVSHKTPKELNDDVSTANASTIYAADNFTSIPRPAPHIGSPLQGCLVRQHEVSYPIEDIAYEGELPSSYASTFNQSCLTNHTEKLFRDATCNNMISRAGLYPSSFKIDHDDDQFATFWKAQNFH